MDTGLMMPANSERQLSDEQSRSVAALMMSNLCVTMRTHFSSSAGKGIGVFALRGVPSPVTPIFTGGTNTTWAKIRSGMRRVT